MRLALIDLDGVVADAGTRFDKAEYAKQTFLESVPGASEKEATGIYWTTVFTPSLVELDIPIENVNDALLDIQAADYKAIFMTSRPEKMRDATIEWLFKHTVYDSDDELVMKASAFQYTKTPVWKAGMVQTLAALYHASHVLVVDDEQFNLDEIIKQSLAPPQVRGLMVAKSLSEAVAKLNGTWIEPEPFLPQE